MDSQDKSAKKVAREMLPAVVMPDEDIKITSTVIDQALAKGLDQEGLMRMKAMEHTIVFLRNRSAGPDTIDEVYNKFYEKLSNTHGTEQQEQRR